MKKLYSLALLFVCASSFGQLYVRRTFDFRDTTNSAWFKRGSDNIAVILIDGYLTGKLRGYKFETDYEVLKSAPVPKEYLPAAWSPEEDYFADDRVEYKGKYYVAVADGTRGRSPDKDTNYWRAFELKGETVSERYFFPSPADTLSRNDFPAYFLMSPGSEFETWQPDREYYGGDYVTYQGYNYEAATDNKGKNPLNSPDDWFRTYAGMPMFYLSSNVLGVSVMYYAEVVNGKEVLIPQMITPLLYDDNIGFLKNMSLHFKYNDAVDYLNKVRQPLLYDSNVGLVGNKFILHWAERDVLTDLLHSLLVSKKIKPGKKEILDQKEYDRFLNDTDKPSDADRWSAWQDLRTSDIFISVTDFYAPRVSLRLSPKTLAKVQFQKSTRVITGLEAIQSAPLNFRSDTTAIDSLPPLKNTSVVRAASNNYMFREKYHARVDSGRNAKLLAALKPAWEIIKQKFYAGQLKPVSPYYTPFPWDHTFTDVKVERSTFSELRLGRDEDSLPDSLSTGKIFTGVAITYTKRFGTNSEYSFTPENVSILIEIDGEPGFSEGVTFGWAALKNVLMSSPEAKQMIGLIESGTLSFDNAEVDYGLTE